MPESEGKFNPELCQFREEVNLSFEDVTGKLQHLVSRLANFYVDLSEALWFVRRLRKLLEQKPETNAQPSMNPAGGRADDVPRTG